MEQDIPLSKLVSLGLKAVTAAASEVSRAQFALDYRTLFKADGSPATDADRASEQIIIDTILAAYPEHRLHGEEFGPQNSDSGSPYLWVFDPIDGTWSFLNQENTACINLALYHDNKLLLGIVFNPVNHEVFLAAYGQGASLNGRELPLTNWETLQQGVMNYHLPRSHTAGIRSLLNIWSEGHIGKLISQGGSPAYGLAMVAKGAHSSFLMAGKPNGADPWDLSAGTLLVRRAGGVVTDLRGNDIDPLGHSDYLLASTNPRVHEQLLGLLRDYHFLAH